MGDFEGRQVEGEEKEKLELELRAPEKREGSKVPEARIVSQCGSSQNGKGKDGSDPPPDL